MLLQKIYQNRSKRLEMLLSKPKHKLTADERKELYELLFKDKKKPEENAAPPKQ
ncbi:hypothetical protein BSNK01_05530 [Bacillaceae bacterium]